MVKRVKVLVSLRKDLIDDLDSLAESADCDRSEVVEDLLDHCLKNEEIVDEVFPEEEEEEDTSEIEEEGGEEASESD